MGGINCKIFGKLWRAFYKREVDSCQNSLHRVYWPLFNQVLLFPGQLQTSIVFSYFSDNNTNNTDKIIVSKIDIVLEENVVDFFDGE